MNRPGWVDDEQEDAPAEVASAIRAWAARTL
jgi:hypothetical protein